MRTSPMRMYEPIACLLLLALASACSDDTGAPKPDAKAACTPLTCAGAGKNCGAMPDGCGQTVQCGASCPTGQTCGGGGVANVCATGTCTAKTSCDPGKNCGSISDGCSDVISCGLCTAPQSCGGAGVANVCGLGPDGGAPSPDQGGNFGKCSASCMDQTGAECCTKCGCTAKVKCTPVCPNGKPWDCEMERCYQ